MRGPLGSVIDIPSWTLPWRYRAKRNLTLRRLTRNLLFYSLSLFGSVIDIPSWTLPWRYRAKRNLTLRRLTRNLFYSLSLSLFDIKMLYWLDKLFSLTRNLLFYSLSLFGSVIDILRGRCPGVIGLNET